MTTYEYRVFVTVGDDGQVIDSWIEYGNQHVWVYDVGGIAEHAERQWRDTREGQAEEAAEARLER